MFLSPVLPTRMFKEKKHPTLLLAVFPPQLPAECDALAAAQAGALEETFFLYREAQRCIGLHSFTLPLSLLGAARGLKLEVGANDALK